MLRPCALTIVLLCLLAPEARADDVDRSEIRRRIAPAAACGRTRLVRGACLLPRRYWYQCYFRPRTTADRVSLATAAGLSVASGVILSTGDEELIKTSSDVTQWVAAGAAVVPLARRDWRGATQLGLTLALTGGLVWTGKELIDKQRPKVEGGRSYPSGHTAPAFAGAAFLYERYGPRYGIPAYVLAIHTGVARVLGNRHYLDDVIAGAGIGMLSAGLFEEIFNGRCKPCTPWTWKPCWRYEFGFGAFWQNENTVRSPASGGTDFDLARLGDWTDARASARLTVEYFPTHCDEIALRIDPAEIATRATAPFPISFDGATIPAGTPIVARWRGNEYRVRWRRDLLPRNRCVALRAGGSLVLAESGVEIEGTTSSRSVISWHLAPCPHIALAYEVLPRVTLSVLGEGVPGVSFFGFDLEAAVRVAITPRWDAGLVYRRWWRPLDNARLADDASTQALFVTIGRSF